MQNKNRIATYIERHERTCARIFGLTFVAGYFASKNKEREKPPRMARKASVVDIRVAG